MLSEEKLTELFRYSFSLIDSRMTPNQQAFCRAIESAATTPLLAEIERLTRELEEARKDAERYRWLRDRNSHHQFRSAWISSVTAVKDGPCDIFSADEVPALLDSEIDRRMAAISAAIKEQT